MTIESNNAQILVRDHDGSAGVNINRAISGFGADLMFWGGESYLARREGEPFVHVLIVPGERWLQDLKDDGWKIVGKLSELTLAVAPTPA